jgi:hypothetical protein
MAVTYTKVSERGVDGSGNRKRSVYDVAYSAEPYSAGVPLDKGKLGAEIVLEELFLMDMSSADSDLVKYDSANEKLRVYDAAGTEAAGNLTKTVRVVAEGY